MLFPLPFDGRLAGNNGSDLGVTVEDAGQVARNERVKDDDGDLVFGAKGESGSVHYAQMQFDGILIGKQRETLGVRIFLGVGVVNAVDFGGFQQRVHTQFAGAESRRGIGGKERIAGAAAKDDDASFSRWRTALRRMKGSATRFISMPVWTRVGTPDFSSVF